MRIKLVLILICIGVTHPVFAQQPDKTVPVDSAKVYKAIQKVAKKKTFSKWLFSLVFTIPEKAPKTKKRVKRLPPKNFNVFEGKFIRNIDILTLDPFGYDIRDTSIRPAGFVKNAGNKLHVKTLSIAVRNLLLFKQNEAFDSLVVKESERLIRKQKYVHDVTFSPQLVKKDSVDIFIRVLDVWSLSPHGSFSSSLVRLGFTDQNFLGTGQQFDNIFALNTKEKRSAYETGYYIPNIRNTYIGARLQYQINQDRSFIRVLDIERTFFSPLTKWGGGIYIGQKLNKDTLLFPDSSKIFQNFRFNTQDVWLAKSWRLFGGKTELQRTTNLILSTRFEHIHYLEKPVEDYDSLRIYSDERFVYFGLGVSSRQYVQDKYVFNYGLVEDIPRGKMYGIVGGYQVKNNIGRLYLGLKASWGDYYHWGYLSTNLEYGRFIHNGSFEEGAIVIGMDYFSELIDVGKWKIRQFIKPQMIFGIKRLPTDKLTINDGYGITGFKAEDLYGIHKILFTLQTQSYAPWNLIGFRFGPYAVYSLGMLGSYNKGFKGSRLYSLLGLGVLVKNDFLVFKTFQISLAFYPIIPGKGNNISKFNTYKTSDFGFMDFEITKPSTVTYQ